MSWVKTNFVNGVTKYNASVGNNTEEGVEEAKTAAANALSVANTKITKGEAETIAKAAAEKVEAEAVNVVSTVAQTRSGLPTIDGITLSSGQKVLETAATEGVNNGVWEVAAGPWKRPSGFAHGEVLPLGLFITILEGTSEHAGSIWVLKNKTAVTVDTTSEEWLINGPGTGVGGKGSEFVNVLTGEAQGTSVGEGALEALLKSSLGEQVVHKSNTAIGWKALQLLKGTHSAGNKITSTTALTGVTFTSTGIEAALGPALITAGSSNTRVIIFTKLTAGVTTPALNVGYFVKGVTANTMELYELEPGTSVPKAAAIKVAGHAVESDSVFTIMNSTEDNTAIGAQAGSQLTTGGGNTLVGFLSGANLTTGEENYVFGVESLVYEKTGIGHIAIGFRALRRQEIGLVSEKSPGWNYAIGYDVLEENKTGFNNIAIGHQVMQTGTGQAFNLAIGHQNMLKASAGAEENVALGIQTMKSLETGKFNVATGGTALDALKSGSKNVAIGTEAGAALTTQSGNVLIGHQAGKSLAAENKLMIANNGTTAIIEGVMSATAASNELKLGTTGGKVSLYGATMVARHATIAVPAETTAANTKAIKELIEAVKAIGIIE